MALDKGTTIRKLNVFCPGADVCGVAVQSTSSGDRMPDAGDSKRDLLVVQIFMMGFKFAVRDRYGVQKVNKLRCLYISDTWQR